MILGDSVISLHGLHCKPGEKRKEPPKERKRKSCIPWLLFFVVWKVVLSLALDLIEDDGAVFCDRWEAEGGCETEVVEIVLRFRSLSCRSKVLISALTSSRASSKFSTVSSIEFKRTLWNASSLSSSLMASWPAC